MDITRRDFFKLTGMTSAGALFGGTVFLNGCKSNSKLKGTKETTTICPYCSVGCGLIVSTRDGKIINIEGNPDHPINQGSLCSKGAALYQMEVNKRRLDRVLHRKPYSAEWEEITWEEAVKKIARRVKDTRDTTFQEKDENVPVNRTNGIACFGGSALGNEECYLLSKFARILGVAGLENQARISHSATVAGLEATFGLGAMTNHWIDIKNADVILVMGSNAAENHPVSFKWIERAMEEREAKLIVVDPRVTRTASLASIYAPIRPGTDLVFLGGIINYALSNNRVQKEYIIEYTNASYLVNPDFGFSNGLFSGFDMSKKKYDKKTWSYQLDEKGIPRRDQSLKDPNCVYQLLKNHYSRYTADKVESATGCPSDTFLKIAEIITSTHQPDRAATIMYGTGITQHTVGTQNVRALGALQLLLGNIGLAGGGINALRCGSNAQGSTDHGLLFHLLPGYLPAPEAVKHPTLAKYNETTPKTNDPMSINSWSNRPNYLVSLLKAWFGDEATKEDDYCYDWLPKSSRPLPYTALFEDMMKGTIKGALYMGTNPIISGPNANRIAKAMDNLEWLVAADIWETDSSIFWKRPGADPSKIKTEVFLLPAASPIEKEGSISNSGRWAQWRYKAVNPPGGAISELDIINKIFLEIRNLYKKEGGKLPYPITKSVWDYTVKGEHEPSPHSVALEINGYTWADKEEIETFMDLKDDGSTACGCWIYCGSYPGKNLMAEKGSEEGPGGTGLYPEWSWCWPLNRRILYNRASVDRKGAPWKKEHNVIEWTGSRWKGDAADGGPDFGPAEKNPFVMNDDGVGRLFAKGLADGPFPEHYEPAESPVSNMLNSQKVNPSALTADGTAGQFASSGQYPHIATLYNVGEHLQSGAMTRNLPWITELVPCMFCEISPDLAKAKMINNGDRVRIFNARGSIVARALVTERIKPLKAGGKTVEIIGMVWHFGFGCGVQGDASNQLSPSVGDANAMIPEYKAFLADIRKEA